VNEEIVRTCLFYRSTAMGKRCVLMPPEEWRMRRDKLLPLCKHEGRGCPQLLKYFNENRYAR